MLVGYPIVDVVDGTYLEDPRKIRPNMITTNVVNASAFRGSPSLWWTWAKNRDAGRPPSLA